MKIANVKWGCGNFRILVLDELHSATFVKKMNVDPCEIFFVNMHRLTIYILPLLMGLSMIIQTRLNPTPPDPVQAKIMKIMPIIFSVFFFFFPSGLVLYWLANNILSIAQQWRITSVIEGKTNPNVSK